MAKYDALVKQLKEKGIEFYTVTIDDIEFYVKPASKKILAKVLPLAEKHPVNAYEILLKEVYLGGDNNVFEDTNIFLSAMSAIMTLIAPYEDTEIEKGEDNIYTITIKVGKKKYKAKLRGLDIPTLATVIDKYNIGDTVGAFEVVLDRCWIEGDKEIKSDVKLFVSAMAVLDRMITVKEATLKKN